MSRLEDKTRRYVSGGSVEGKCNFRCACRYYHQGEVKDFEGNECEWPLFYTFLIIDGVFKSNTEQIEEYQAELRKCLYADANGGWETPFSARRH